MSHDETPESEAINHLAERVRRLAEAVTPNVVGCDVEDGSHVASLTEAVIFVGSSLYRLSNEVGALREEFIFTLTEEFERRRRETGGGNEDTEAGPPMRLVVVTCSVSSDQCLFIDGRRWESFCETTVYASDISDAAGSRPLLLSFLAVDERPDVWPVCLEALDLRGSETGEENKDAEAGPPGPGGDGPENDG
jgi:hypothetical protein